MRSGNPNGNPKLKPNQARHIADEFRQHGWGAALRLHRQYGVSKSAVEKLIIGINWSHITGIPKREETTV